MLVIGLVMYSVAEKQPALNRAIQAAILLMFGASLLAVLSLALIALQHFTGWGHNTVRRW